MIERFTPMIHRVVNRFYTTAVISRDDLFNEAVVIILELLDKNTDDGTFMNYAERTINGKLIKMLNHSASLSNVEEFEGIEESLLDRITHIEVNTHAHNLIQEFIVGRYDMVGEELFFNRIIENEKSVEEIVAKYGKDKYNAHKRVQHMRSKFKAYVLNNVNNDLIKP